MLRWLFRSLCLVCLLSFQPIQSTPVFAGQCLQDIRILKSGGNNMRLRDYLCRTQSNQNVRVRFHRVTDFVAHGILAGNLPAGFKTLFGKPKLISNEVHREYKNLMEKFGEYTQGFGCETYKVIAAGKGQGMQGGNQCAGKIPIRRSIGGWYQSLEDSVFPAADDLRSLEYNGTVPKAYKSKTVIEYGERVKKIWRYAKRRDFKNYKKKLRDYNALITALKKTREGSMDNKYFSMLEYVTRKGVPRKFMVIHGNAEMPAECAGYAARWVLKYTERAMLVDVAVVENTSTNVIKIKQLLGAKSKKTKLRSLSKSTALRKKQASPLGTGALILHPGDKALLFQRMAFIVDDTRQAGFNLPGYVYGPEVLLKGLEVNGERLDLEGQSSNFVSLTTGDEGGSCPYLHVWSSELNDYINTGKILDKAKGAGLEQADQRRFEGFKSRFRIHEREPELAHIDQASLLITLKSGEKHVLKPDVEGLVAPDQKRLKLGYGEYVDLRFSLPAGIKEKEVAHSTITLTGYYERYGELFNMSKLTRPLDLLIKVVK
ncbi:MAG: hypothetical protein GY927_05835 [bacterium]|nr:hypothetical protein [bacterium]